MIKKIFAPINRWKFIFYIFLFWIFNALFVNFVRFFDFYGMVSVDFACLDFLVILFIVFKRLFDIFDKLWKTVIFALFSVLLQVVTFVLSISPLYDLNATTINNKVLLLYPLYSLALVLFLLLKNGKNSKFFNFELKKILKRVALLIFIFSICKLLLISFSTFPLKVDFRMYPTLELGDRLLVNKIIGSTSLKREDIVCIKNNDWSSRPLRIIGLPNEEIKLDGKKVYINGKLYSDKYAFYGTNLKPINFQETIKLDSYSYFLMGDNRYYDKRGKIFTKDKNGNKVWRNISFYSITDERNKNVYLTLKRDELFGKVIAIHYDNLDKKILRDSRSYAFATKNKKFGFNPTSVSDKIFGKQ